MGCWGPGNFLVRVSSTNKKRGLGGPRCLFCLYFYFIKLRGVNWTFWRENFSFGCLGLGELAVVGGLTRFRLRSLGLTVGRWRINSRFLGALSALCAAASARNDKDDSLRSTSMLFAGYSDPLFHLIQILG
jgi:hypothetical protein